MSPSSDHSSSDSDGKLLWQLAAPSLAASLALLAIAVLAAVVLFVNQRQADVIMEDVSAAVAAAVDLEEAIVELRHRLAHFAATGDEGVMSDVPGLQRAGGQYLLQIERVHLRTNQGSVLVTGLSQSYRGLCDALDDLSIDTPQQERREKAQHLVSELLDPDLLSRVRQQQNLAAQALRTAEARGRELTTWTGWTLLILGVTGAAAGALGGFALARGLKQQLVELSVPIETAAGSLRTVVGPLYVRTIGNVQDLESSLNVVATRVADVVDRLRIAELESLRKDQMSALGQLAAGLAHELRNPLTAIRTLVEVARGQGPEGRLDARDLEVLEEEVCRLDDTLQSFLDYARPPKLVQREIDLRDVVRRTSHLVSARAEQQSIRLDVELPDEPLQVNADAEQIRQVLLNLVLNAFDAIGTKGHVVINAHRDTSQRQCVLSVSDNGPGIQDGMHRNLFDPFISSKPAGTGLGLTISRRITENHGGTIDARNRSEGGAEFIVRLPEV